MIIQLFIAILLKSFLFICFFLIARHFFKTYLESLVVTYLLTLVAQNAILLFLSPFHWVTAWGIGIAYVLCGTALLAVEYFGPKKRNLPINLEKPEPLKAFEIVTISLFCILFVALAIRPFFYLDTTDDALIQGMTKLAFIEQHQTLFVHYDSLTINTFSNEWLGELNGLFYMLIIGNESGALFGNAEMFLFIAVAALYCVRAFGYQGKYAYPIAFVCVTLPVITGLTMTIKTDLSSIILLPLSVAFLLQYYRSESPNALFASILAIGAAASSKISSLPGAGLLLLALILFYFFKAKKKPVLPVIAGAVMAAILCNRYVLNLVQYHNPFQRALNEKMQFSIGNFKNSLVGLNHLLHGSDFSLLKI
jgi:hypothetical protein